MTEERLREIENVASVVIGQPHACRVSARKLASEHVPELIAEVRRLRALDHVGGAGPLCEDWGDEG